jgi:hypothetical protein
MDGIIAEVPAEVKREGGWATVLCTAMLCVIDSQRRVRSRATSKRQNVKSVCHQGYRSPVAMCGRFSAECGAGRRLIAKTSNRWATKDIEARLLCVVDSQQSAERGGVKRQSVRPVGHQGDRSPVAMCGRFSAECGAGRRQTPNRQTGEPPRI